MKARNYSIKWMCTFVAILMVGALVCTGCPGPSTAGGGSGSGGGNGGNIQQAINNAPAGSTVTLNSSMTGTTLNVDKPLTIDGNGIANVTINVDPQIATNVTIRNFVNASVNITVDEEGRAARSIGRFAGSGGRPAANPTAGEVEEQEIKSAQEVFGSIYGDEQRFTVEGCSFKEFNVEDDVALMISTKGDPSTFEKITISEDVEDFYIIEKDLETAEEGDKGLIKELKFEGDLENFAMIGTKVDDVTIADDADFRFVFDEETTVIKDDVLAELKEDIDVKDITYTKICDDTEVIQEGHHRYKMSFPVDVWMGLSNVMIYFYPKAQIDGIVADCVDYSEYAEKEARLLWDEDMGECLSMYPDLTDQTKEGFIARHIAETAASNKRIPDFMNEGKQDTNDNPIQNHYMISGMYKEHTEPWGPAENNGYIVSTGLYQVYNTDATVIKDFHVYNLREPSMLNGVYVEYEALPGTTEEEGWDFVNYYIDLDLLKSTDLHLEGHEWDGFYMDKLTNIDLSGYAPYVSTTLQGYDIGEWGENYYTFSDMFEMYPCSDEEWPTEAEIEGRFIEYPEGLGDMGFAYPEQEEYYLDFEAYLGDVKLELPKTHNLVDDSMFREGERNGDPEFPLLIRKQFICYPEENVNTIEIKLLDENGDYWAFETNPEYVPNHWMEPGNRLTKNKMKNYGSTPKSTILPGELKAGYKYTFTFVYRVNKNSRTGALEPAFYWDNFNEEDKVTFLDFYTINPRVEYKIQNVEPPAYIHFDEYGLVTHGRIEFDQNSNYATLEEAIQSRFNDYSIAIYKSFNEETYELSNPITDADTLSAYQVTGYRSEFNFYDGIDVEVTSEKPLFVYMNAPFVKVSYWETLYPNLNITYKGWRAYDDFKEHIDSFFMEGVHLYLDPEMTIEIVREPVADGVTDKVYFLDIEPETMVYQFGSYNNMDDAFEERVYYYTPQDIHPDGSVSVQYNIITAESPLLSDEYTYYKTFENGIYSNPYTVQELVEIIAAIGTPNENGAYPEMTDVNDTRLNLAWGPNGEVVEYKIYAEHNVNSGD